ncbi:kinesin-like protein KIF6 [Myotis daubentonii]|uniref:kinesin-like protein KIF6 n=1 Tax=Myotis daubentonii TaxID=98922 RepID=UPI0028733E4D|nr:kinesin-like protein KIF6 [Myotis daubentonii]
MREEMSLGRQEAFEIFKRDHADSVTIEDNKQILKQRFSEAKSLGENINEARSKIGHLKEAITQRHLQQAALGPGYDGTSPEPFNRDLPPVTTAALSSSPTHLCESTSPVLYKTMFTRLKALKVEIEHLQLLMDRAKVKLQKEFEAWWAAEASSLQVDPLAGNSPSHTQPLPPRPGPQHERPPLLSNQSVYSRKILPSPRPILPSPEETGPRASLDDSIPERRASSVPLTGDSQTDSDILAFIKARQNVLQKKCGQLPLPPDPKASDPWLGPRHTGGLSGGLACGVPGWKRQFSCRCGLANEVSNECSIGMSCVSREPPTLRSKDMAAPREPRMAQELRSVGALGHCRIGAETPTPTRK